MHTSLRLLEIMLVFKMTVQMSIYLYFKQSHSKNPVLNVRQEQTRINVSTDTDGDKEIKYYQVLKK